MNKYMLDQDIMAVLLLRGASSVRIVTNGVQDGRKTAGVEWSPLSNATVRNRLLYLEKCGLVKRQNKGPGERHWWVAA